MEASLLWRGRRQVLILLVALVGGAILTRGDSAPVSAGGNWAASTDVAVAVLAPGAVTDYTTTLTIPAADLNFSSVVTMSPETGVIAPDGAPDPAVGDIVGDVMMPAVLGIGNGACVGPPFPLAFPLMVATTANGVAMEIAASNAGDSSVVVPTGTLAPLLHDVNALSDPPPTADGGSEPPSAVSPPNGIPGHVDLYPKYLNVLFDPDTPGGPAPPVVPHARYSGGDVVAGRAVIFTIMVFSPTGANSLAAFDPPHPLSDLEATNLGYKSVSVFLDPTSEPSSDGITDFCSPLVVTTTLLGETLTNPCVGLGAVFPCLGDAFINDPAPFGPPTGLIRYTNPPVAGTHFFGSFQQSLRDLDGDTYENALDTCPYGINMDVSPRIADGPDLPAGDMLDSVCDPTPGGPASEGDNADGDAAINGTPLLNAGDNCPTVGNASNNDGELDAMENVRRPRGGESADGIGDACDVAETACADALDNDPDLDPGPGVIATGPDGLVNDGCPALDGNGALPAGAEAICTNPTAAVNGDNDGDGVVNDGCPAVGGGRNNEFGAECAPPDADDDDGDTLVNDGCPAVGPIEAPQCGNIADEDGDTLVNDGCPVAGAFPESGVGGCANAVDEADEDPGPPVTQDDTIINDGCPASGVPEIISGAPCTNAFSDDDDVAPLGVGPEDAVNDGCAAAGPPRSEEIAGECSNAVDDDEDTLVNDGCPAVGLFSESGVAGCANAVDEADEDPGAPVTDDDFVVNDGCPTAGPARFDEIDTECGDAADTDVDSFVNDGCPTAGSFSESGVAGCANAVDEADEDPGAPVTNDDIVINDGCPTVGPAETAGAHCNNFTHGDDDNGDTVINSADTMNDGCPIVGTDAEFGCLNNFDDDGDTVINDGCTNSANVANGHYHTTFDLLPVCIGMVDGDGDGWCDLPPGDPLDDPADGVAAITPEHYSLVRFFPVASSGSGAMPPASREPLQVCNDGIDNDGDALIDLLEGDGPDGGVAGMWDCNPRSTTLPAADTDGDGYPDASEIYTGTDPMGRCEKSGGGVGQSNDWPADHVGGALSGDKITLTDLSTYTAIPRRFNTKPGDANFLPRYDVNPGTVTPGAAANWIVLTDLSNISILTPAMFGGVRAFGGPVCAAHLTLND